MIGLLVALLSGGVAVAGCHSVGHDLICDLDPPPPASKPASVVVRLVPPIPRSAPSAAKPMGKRHPTLVARASASPKTKSDLVKSVAQPPPGEIQRRLASLVSIGDCTGARAYAQSVGATKLADPTYAACAGLPNAPRLSYAIEPSPQVAAVGATNDAIIDQIPDMP